MKPKAFFFPNLNFRLLSMHFKDHPVLQEIKLNFTDQSDLNKSKQQVNPYFTVIIGPNGTGKSNILRAVIDLFRDIEELQRTGTRTNFLKGQFYVSYMSNGQLHQVSNCTGIKKDKVIIEIGDELFEIPFDVQNETLKLLKRRDKIIHVVNGGINTDLKQLDCPSSIIATSIMLTDKYPTVKKDNDFYKYLGVRRENSGIIAGTRTYITRIVNHVIESLDNEVFVEKLDKMLSYLDLKKSLYISYTPKFREQIFHKDLDEAFFTSFFEKFWKHTKREKEKPPFSVNYYNANIKGNETLISALVRECKRISKEFEFEGNSKTPYFGFEVFDENQHAKRRAKNIQHLYKLDLITYPTINLSKKAVDFDIEKSSSGEAHFLTTMIGIAATIKQNSIVLIDEPEISLHPNWQMKYIEFIAKNFKEYSSCQFIIATHSPYLISDLHLESSHIIGLRKKDKIEVIKGLENVNTYGWSVEQILLEVFEAPGDRNFYVSDIVKKAIDLMSDPYSTPKQVENQLDLVRMINIENMKASDPFKKIINTLLEEDVAQ